MDEILASLDEADIAILNAFAESGMNVTRTARNTFYDRRTVSNRLTGIHRKTGIDPRTFWGLLSLFFIIKRKEIASGLSHD